MPLPSLPIVNGVITQRISPIGETVQPQHTTVTGTTALTVGTMSEGTETEILDMLQVIVDEVDHHRLDEGRILDLVATDDIRVPPLLGLDITIVVLNEGD